MMMNTAFGIGHLFECLWTQTRQKRNEEMKCFLEFSPVYSMCVYTFQHFYEWYLKRVFVFTIFFGHSTVLAACRFGKGKIIRPCLLEELWLISFPPLFIFYPNNLIGKFWSIKKFRSTNKYWRRITSCKLPCLNIISKSPLPGICAIKLSV